MSTYAEDSQHVDHIRAENQRQLDEDAAITEFFRRHADAVENCIASRRAIQDYMNGDAITIEALETSWREHPAFRDQLALHSPQEDRSKLEHEIKALLAGSPQSVAEQLKKVRYKTNAELRHWCEELRARKDAREKTPDELRAIIRAAAPTVPEELPKSISKQQILYMLSGSDIRELARKYSMAAITKRVNEKD
jgi:hypothetical protein